MMNRRSFLGTVGTVTGISLAGCVLDLDPIGAGTLVIDNEQNRSHTLRITVTKTSDDSDDVPPRSQTPTTSVWRRDQTFEVSGGGRVRKSGFISEPGAFYIEARSETGESASTWLGLYAAGGGVAERHIYINIKESGRMFASTPVDD